MFLRTPVDLERGPAEGNEALASLVTKKENTSSFHGICVVPAM
jgi:hypothetical protein